MRLVWELARRTVREFLDDDCLHMAAGMAYYAFFSLFPLLLGIIAVLGLVLESVEIQRRVIEMTTRTLPGSGDLVVRNIEGVMASREMIGLISLIGLFWSATAIFAAIRRSLNRAWDAERDRPFIKQKLLDLGMIVGVGLLLLTSLAATALFRIAWQYLSPLEGFQEGGLLWHAATTLMPLAFTCSVFALIYRFVPNTNVAWRDVWLGALLAAVLFEAAKNGFAWYLANVANYAMVYGSLEVVIIFLFWAYISALVLLFGAELSSEYSKLFGSRSPRVYLAAEQEHMTACSTPESEGN